MIGSKKDFPQVSINLLFHTKPGYLFIKYLFALEAKKELDEEPNWQGWNSSSGIPRGCLPPADFRKSMFTRPIRLSRHVCQRVCEVLGNVATRHVRVAKQENHPFSPDVQFLYNCVKIRG